MSSVQLADVSTRCSSHPQVPNIKLSTKNLRCFYTATATEKDVTSFITLQACQEANICNFLATIRWVVHSLIRVEMW